MPRIRKPQFYSVVEKLKLRLGGNFTQEKPYAHYKIGEEVVTNDMRGIGYVVGYRTTTDTTIAYFPENTHFYGAALVGGCYSSHFFKRR